MEGDQHKMREAFEEIIEKIDAWRTDGTMEHWQYSQLFDIADAALSAPTRNCDVGTAEEQEKRFYEKFCVKSCLTCRLSGLKRSRKADCIMTWAQMPYEAQEGDAQ